MGLFAAVDRCASGVSRHAGRIIYLRYKGSASAEKTVYLVGKGVTYDTGGADIKAGGVGEPYSIVMDNGPAARMDVAKQLQHSGHVMGDFFEISTIRKEDYAFHQGKSEYEDVLQANNLPSSRTA